jgi:hypothetical protein
MQPLANLYERLREETDRCGADRIIHATPTHAAWIAYWRGWDWSRNECAPSNHRNATHWLLRAHTNERLAER